MDYRKGETEEIACSVCGLPKDFNETLNSKEVLQSTASRSHVFLDHSLTVAAKYFSLFDSGLSVVVSH